jgi:filamentous hemagglutinin family protein
MKRIPSLLNSSHLRKMTAYLLVWSLINGPAWALTSANITSATNAGAVTAAGTTTVGVTADKAVVNWNNFNTVAGETLAFERAGGGNFAVLNRISGSQTTFNGNLNGNQGMIIVVNTNGIVFGPTAQITAAGFVASGLNMLDTDFMSGNYTFANGAGIITNKGTITAGQVALIGSSVKNTGTIVSPGGYIAMISGSEVVLGSSASDVFVLKNVTPVNYSSKTTGEVANSGTLDNPDGTVVLAAGDSFSQALDLDGLDAQAVGTVKQLGTVNAETLEMTAIKSVTVQGDTASGGDMKIRADKNAVSMGGDVESGGDMSIEAGTNISLFGDTTSGGDMAITTHDEGTFSVGNFVAEGDIDLNTNLSLGGGEWEYDESLYTWIWSGDQTIHAKDGGAVTAYGWIHKEAPGQLFIIGSDSELSVDLRYSGCQWGVSNMGNIYILGLGDVQLSGNLTGKGAGYDVWDFLEGKYEIEPSLMDRGGVYVNSLLGSIYTAGTGGVNVTIEGYSNNIDGTEAGVYLPDGAGRAAIVLRSSDTLNVGPHAFLNADGAYISANDDPQMGVDDRRGNDYLDEDQVIGGYERDKGIASDVAIYAASKKGNVNIAGQIHVTNEASDVSSATVYFDAYDTVLIPDTGILTDGGYRLEVASRITEWLHEAIDNGTLPYAYDPAYIEAILGNDYVLRGAGDFVDYKDSSDLPDFSRGRAWVLEDLPTPKIPVPPLADLQIPEIKGCPVQLQAVAMELGVSPEDLQLMINRSMASNPNLQACEACAQVMTSATILKDADGIRMAAMNQIFNTLAPANAPFTPEVSASVVTAFNRMAGQDTQYALAAEYVDAFVRYVAAIDTQIKAPVGDAVAFTMEKYGQALNPNVVSYLMSKVQSENNAL